ncbi:MAG: hypothetical protein JWM99_3964 [Verrucomicrobiales bacterium]|nr:hypothetical protein [Verrucomicrobiales bacterium]
MSFLAPWFLLGALAIGAPILFHLIRRNTRERVLFSSLMFLSPSPPRLTKRKRIENILLLLLRCAVICFVALAFARPYFQKILSAAGAPKTVQKNVLLLDISASMRRADLWKQAQAKALSLLKELNPGDEVAIMSFAGSTRTVLSFDDFRTTREIPGAVAERIAVLSPTWEATHLGAALVAAAESLQDRQEKLTNATPSALTIVVVSDFQTGAKLDELQHFEWPKSVQIRVEPVKSSTRSNASMELATDPEGSTTNNGIRVLLSNSINSQREQFRLAWSARGASNQAQSAMDIYLPPAQKKVVLAPGRSNEGGILNLSGDEDAFDNALYVARNVIDPRNVLYLGSAAAEDTRKPFYYLQRVFGGGGAMAASVTRLSPGVVQNGALARSSFVVTDEALPSSAIEPLKAFISSGHSMLLLLSQPEMAASVQQLLGSGTIECAEASTNRYALLGEIDFQHPLFAPFSDPRFSDFSKIRFWRHRVFKSESIPHGRVLARFDDDAPALVEAPLGKGALYIFASGWQPAESQLAVSSKFVPLLYSFLDESSGANAKISHQFVVGQTVRIPDALQPANSVLVSTPSGQQLSVTNSAFNETSEPGIYQAVGGTNRFSFAVNLEPSESRTTPMGEDELERLGLPIRRLGAKPDSIRPKALAQMHASELEQHQKLWRWGLVGALLFLASEAFVAGRRPQPAP